MKQMHEIISLDPNKVWYENINGIPTFRKITSLTEVNLLNYAKDCLEDTHMCISNKAFRINVPKIYEWNDNTSILTMSFCNGENLECMLCNPATRNFAIEILQATFTFIINNNFFWYDFAPRNILVDSENIYFVDFEKGIDNSISNIKLFLRHHVFEEYSSFLLKSERIFNSEFVYSLYTNEQDKILKTSDIKVKRFKAVALQLGYNDTITLSQLLNIQKLIINAEEPYIKAGEIIFPRIRLTKMLEDKLVNPKVYDEYAKFIISYK